MKISVFLSFPKPHNTRQDAFINRLQEVLRGRGLLPRTLGVTDYGLEAPLAAIRALMIECNGVIAVGLRRTRIDTAVDRPEADLKNQKESQICGEWLTSPWCHIEPAMAFQLGLPTMIFRECGVREDGVFDKGVVGQYMPVFDSSADTEEYFQSIEFNDILGQWEAFVRRVHYSKGQPPRVWQ